jgi:hypothetical protein
VLQVDLANKETHNLKSDVTMLQEENSSLLSQVKPFQTSGLCVSQNVLYLL